MICQTSESSFDTIIMVERKKKLGLRIKIDLDISIFCDKREPENLQLCTHKQLMIWNMEDDLHLLIHTEKPVNIF